MTYIEEKIEDLEERILNLETNITDVLLTNQLRGKLREIIGIDKCPSTVYLVRVNEYESKYIFRIYDNKDDAKDWVKSQLTKDGMRFHSGKAHNQLLSKRPDQVFVEQFSMTDEELHDPELKLVKDLKFVSSKQ